jgi:hypothetical protein
MLKASSVPLQTLKKGCKVAHPYSMNKEKKEYIWSR